MSIYRAMAALVVAGCVAEGGEAQMPGGAGGKADDTLEPAEVADEACTREYITWVLTDFAAALRAKPIDAARATELEALAETAAPCPGVLLGPTAFTTWLDVTNDIAFTPYFMAHAKAFSEFYLANHPDRGSTSKWLAKTAVPTSMKLAVRVMQTTAPRVEVDGLSMQEWLGLYRVMAEQALQPLNDLALQTQLEGYWTLNAGEAEMLDLLATTRPAAPNARLDDGVFAAWIDEYGDILDDGVSIDSDDDYNALNARLGCMPNEVAPCGREKFLDRFAALRPPAVGAADSRQFMYALKLWAMVAATFEDAADLRQLARIDAVRPAPTKGTDAYRVWLETVAETASSIGVYATSVFPAKPCASTGGDELYAAFTASNPALPLSVRDAARPVACAN